MTKPPTKLSGKSKIVLFSGTFILIAAAIFAAFQWRSYIPAIFGKGANVPKGSSTTTTGGSSVSSGITTQMSIKLSQGQAQPHLAELVQYVTGEPLTPEEIQQILDRLPALPVDPNDQTDFRIPPGLLPPPRPGQTVQGSFPPAPTDARPPETASGPLKVLRYSPQGEVPVAPFLSVTFNQPMVPLATLAQLSAQDVPVQIDPPLEGAWRWLGTRTITFQYASDKIDRLPKATVYQVTVPAGVKSASGNELGETVAWTFTTPPPSTVYTYPQDEAQPLDPLFFIAFDQRIDPAAVLQTTEVTAGGQPVEVNLVDKESILVDEKHKWLLDQSVDGRWLAFKAKNLLPADTDVVVNIGPNTPSAEGPLTSQQASSYRFHTYAPLRVEDYGCTWGNQECRPLVPFYINFNNPIDPDVYTDAMIQITPELPGAVVNIYGNTINIQGATQGQTVYKVVISKDLQDTFGQTLGKDTELLFRVGSAEPFLVGPDHTFITIDPASKKPTFNVYSMNYSTLKVKIYSVQPSDWPVYKSYMRTFWGADTKTPEMPGRLVVDKSVSVEGPADTLNETDIDLSEALPGQYGQLAVFVEAPQSLLDPNQGKYGRVVAAWVQVTQIGLDAFFDNSEMVVWASALKDGVPLAGLPVSAGPNGGWTATTSQDGSLRASIPVNAEYLAASQGDDTAMLPRNTEFWSEETWSTNAVFDDLRWYIFDDRQMYRPGEEVHVKGWIRRVGGGQQGDVSSLGGAVDAVNYQITDSQSNNIGNGRADVNALGGFDFAFTVPEQVNLGYAQIVLNAEGSLGGMSGVEQYHAFQIQEFRRPEFEAKARNESEGPYFAGGNATLAVQASYYAGGPLPNAPVTWEVTSSPSSYSPPNWPDFTFGTWRPWWGDYYWEYKGGYPDGSGGKTETFTGQTDSNGEHYLRLDFNTDGGPQPVSVVAQATVQDVNRQAWAGSTTLLVHPADLYIGLRSGQIFVQKGTPIKVDFIVTDLDGNPVAGSPVEVRAARMEWKYKDGEWQEVEADAQTCDLTASGSDPLTCTFQTPLGGSYKITATVTDQQGRQNQSTLTRWVSGGQMPPSRNVEQEKVTLIPNQETYQAGDVAEVLVQSPFSPAEGLLTVSRSGILYVERFQITDGTATLKIPVKEEYTPNLEIQVDVNGSAPRLDDKGEPIPDAPARPAYASGTLSLSIPPLQRTLSLEVEPAENELQPGGETHLNVVLRDASGQPVQGAELAVVVVDEAVLALSNYQMADPIQVFYSNRPSYLTSLYSRSSIVLVNPLSLLNDGQRAAIVNKQEVNAYALDSAAGGALPAAAPAAQPTMTASMESPKDAEGAPSQVIAVRTDFNPLAVFEPEVRTDARGQASVSVKLPDNLTRYRIMVVAVDKERQFGVGESNLTARLPLMVRPSAPRFLNFGDQFELPVILQNQTGADMEVSVVARAGNLSLTGSAGLRVVVPARDRVEVRFPAAADKAGTARIQIAATSGEYADAANIELPVYTPTTTEAFATYGVIDEGATAQTLTTPSGVFPQYGGLEITTSSTALQALTDAVLYLTTYPFEGTEQRASRIIAIAALRDVLTAFNAEGLPSPDEMNASVSRDLEILQALQNEDGGFPYWLKYEESIPFNTIHVAHAMARAEAKGYSVPQDMKQRALGYLQNIESHYPDWYGPDTRHTLSSYALYVRNLMGDRDPRKASNLISEAGGLDKLSLDAVGWLWPVLSDSSQVEEIRTYVSNRVVETAGAANFTDNYTDQNYLLLGSDRRTDAILLDDLMGDNPQSDLIVKVVNGLLAHRKAGRWDNTQENVFVLLALDRYFNTYESQTPDFVARVWLGEGYAGDHTFQGRTTERYQLDIPMSYLVDPSVAGSGEQNLILSKEGNGRLYYRLGLRYAPSDLHLDALDMGFVVQRIYEAVDDPADVWRDAQGAWHIKAGARVRVRLTMEADNRRYHVALVDRLPAGMEVVNPALAVSGSVPRDTSSPDYRSGWWWWGTWYEHQNLRDERVEAFTSLLWEGVYQYTYVTRATTPGTFIVPPAKAEEMYSPETFGRSSSDVVIIE